MQIRFVQETLAESVFGTEGEILIAREKKRAG